MVERHSLIGHSGCALDLVFLNGRHCVRKTSSSLDYNNRLLAQVELLRRLPDHYSHLYWVRVPPVVNTGFTDAGLAYYDLPYVHAYSMVTFLQTAAASDINRLRDRLVDLVCLRTGSCLVTKEVLAAKLEQIEASRAPLPMSPDGSRVFRDTFDDLKSSLKDLELPASSVCHGDLTLDNLLIDSAGLTVIDPLDGYASSPAMDLVKLRQDTQLKWIVSKAARNNVRMVDTARLYSILSHLDDGLVEAFGRQAWYRDSYTTLQRINLLRILPYATSPETLQFLSRSLETLT